MRTATDFDSTGGDPNVVEICNDLYIKTPDAVEKLLAHLRAAGYAVENLRDEKNLKRDGVTAADKEKRGYSLWYARLADTTVGKCRSCGSYISTLGIRAHGHRCEVCNAVTYAEIRDGTTIRFSFIDDNDRWGMADVRMKAKRLDVEDGYIYFYPGVLEGLWLSPERSLQYLEAHKDKWEMVTRWGKRLIKIKYLPPFMRRDDYVSVINVSDMYGHYYNHSIVKMWEGKEYDGMFGRLPLPESINIYEAWHWAPRTQSRELHEQIIHAAGMVSRVDYYYQDGRRAFDEIHLERMRTFVENFTDLDVSKWDAMVRRAPMSGPGFIRAAAAFCQGKAQPTFRNEPNIGNLLVGASKILSGQPLVLEEIEAMDRALSDPQIADDFVDGMGAYARSRR